MADRTNNPAAWFASAMFQIPPAATSLQRALEVSRECDWSFDLDEIKRVEALWELLDGGATSHGFVLRLLDGRRCYLQYVMAPGFDEDEPVKEEEVIEDVEMLSMKDEQYPDLRGGGIDWTDEVDDLNRFLGLSCADA